MGIRSCDQGISSDALLQLSLIIDIMCRLSLPGNKLSGMAFDGAASMKLLAAKIKQMVNSSAIFTHCFAHSNELVEHDVYKTSKMFNDSLDMCQNLYAFVGAYPKRVMLFENIQKDLDHEKNESGENYEILRLQSISVTRWTTRAKAAYVLIGKVGELHTLLDHIKDDKGNSNDIRAKAKGLLKNLESFKCIFKLVGMYEIIIVLEKLSKDLQSRSLTGERAFHSIAIARQRLTDMRTVEEFEKIGIKQKLLFTVLRLLSRLMIMGKVV